MKTTSGPGAIHGSGGAASDGDGDCEADLEVHDVGETGGNDGSSGDFGWDVDEGFDGSGDSDGDGVSFISGGRLPARPTTLARHGKKRNGCAAPGAERMPFFASLRLGVSPIPAPDRGKPLRVPEGPYLCLAGRD